MRLRTGKGFLKVEDVEASSCLDVKLGISSDGRSLRDGSDGFRDLEEEGQGVK